MKKCYLNANILLPNFDDIAPEKWSVVACDQFTSEPEYWEKAKNIIGDAPSTLNLILPEVYLSETENRVKKINDAMNEYLKNVLVEYPDTMIYVERTQSDGTIREGIVLAVDLECYDYTKGANSLIRATEATVVERIPPRVAIRRDAPLELPHVMILIDDPDSTVIEPIDFDKCEKVYDFELMLGGGRIRGGFISKEDQKKISEALDNLITPEAMEKKYGDKELAPLLFSVGDGNHSLASAKATYEEVKAAIGKAAEDHPSRYALVEVVNIHSKALKFEPIYRIVTNVDCESFVNEFAAYANSLDGTLSPQKIDYVFGDKKGSITVKSPTQQLAVGTLQIFIDDYLKKNPEAGVDYIHGEGSVIALSQKERSVGFLFEGMAKSELFKTVIFDGALPRKTFSMGHAEDKRYYLECRKIK